MFLRINKFFFSGYKALSSDSSKFSGHCLEFLQQAGDSGSSLEVSYNLPAQGCGPDLRASSRNLGKSLAHGWNLENWEPRFFCWAFCMVSVKSAAPFGTPFPVKHRASGVCFVSLRARLCCVLKVKLLCPSHSWQNHVNVFSSYDPEPPHRAERGSWETPLTFWGTFDLHSTSQWFP